MTYFHGCYSVGADRLWGINRRRKGSGNTLLALKTIRRARPDGRQIWVILDNLSAHKNKDIRTWAADNQVTLLFTPSYASSSGPGSGRGARQRPSSWPRRGICRVGGGVGPPRRGGRTRCPPC